MIKMKEVATICGPVGCPTVFETGESAAAQPQAGSIGFKNGADESGTDSDTPDDYLVIIGSVLTAEERASVSHRIAPDETAVRVPKALITGLKFT